MSGEFRLDQPVSELEIADALNQDTYVPVGVIRRLAFERDINKAVTARLRADRDRLLAVLKAGLRYIECDHLAVIAGCERCKIRLEVYEAIRLAEEE